MSKNPLLFYSEISFANAAQPTLLSHWSLLRRGLPSQQSYLTRSPRGAFLGLLNRQLPSHLPCLLLSSRQLVIRFHEAGSEEERLSTSTDFFH